MLNNKSYNFTNESFKNRMSNYFNPYGINLDYNDSVNEREKLKSTLHNRSIKQEKRD